ncbi:uncharacterized protein ACN2A1_007634 [Glossina fuscipes fuscipes]
MYRSTYLLMLEIYFLAIGFNAVYAQKFKDIHYLQDMPNTSIDSLIQEKPTLYCDTKTNLYNVITKLNEKHAIFVTWHRTKANNWDILEQFCSVDNGLQAKRRCVYNHLTQSTNWEPFLEKELISCELSMYCKEEEFRHYFVQTDGQLIDFVNKWKPGVVGEKSGLLKVCLKPNGVPLTRKCLYDKEKQLAHWESLSNLDGYKCLSETNQKIISKKLNDLHNDIQTNGLLHKSIDERKAVANQILNLLDQPDSQRLPADVFTTSEILKLMTTETRNMQLSTDVVKIVNNMMTSDAKILRISADLNATNAILATFENYMDALSDNFVQQNECEKFNSSKIPANNTSADIKIVNLAHLGVFIYFTFNISTFFINPLCANISGIALYPIEARITNSITYTIAAKNDSHRGIRYRFVYMNESIVELLKDTQLNLATFIPLKTMQPIQDELRLTGKKASIVLKIYSNDALFVETDTTRLRKPSGEVLSISLPSYEGQLMQELPFILRINYLDMSTAKNSNPNCGCGYWNYKTWISNEKAIAKSSISHSLESNMKVYHIFLLIYLRQEVNGQKLCPVDHYEVSFRSLEDNITIVIKWEKAKVGTTSILRDICSNITGLPLERHCSYNRDTGEAEWSPYNKNESVLHCYLISYHCKSDPFEHDFFMKGNVLKPYENYWKTSYNPGLIELQIPCLQANGLPIARRCLYNPAKHVIEWESIEHWPRISCYESSYSVINQQLVTDELSGWQREFIGSEQLYPNDSVRFVNEFTTILESPQHVLLPADIELTGKFLQFVVQSNPEPSLMKAIMDLTNTVMSSDSAVLSLSAEMNATNTCLKAFEDYVNKTAALIAKQRCVNEPKVQIEITENIGVFIVNPKCTNISGLAIYSSHITPRSAHYHSMHFEGLSNLYYRYLYLNQSVGDLLQEQNLLLASFVPEKMWNKMCNELWSHDEYGIVAIKVYKNDKLFVETSPIVDHKPNGAILSFTITNYTGLLVEDLPIIFSKRNLHKYSDIHFGCAYWNYTTWDRRGVRVVDSIDGQSLQDYVLCYSNHLTPFSYLMGGIFERPNTKNVVLITLRHIKALDIISMIGCSASLIGLLCIWFTALLIKNWRSLSSNKVLLHLCAVLTLIILTFIAINLNCVIEQLMANSTYCVIMGAFLQYIILVLFVWMLIIAILQYQRFVIVLGIVRPKYYITKSAIVAWSLPLIPTLYVALTIPESYVPTYEQWIRNSGICYPTGHGLNFGVVLPISIVVTINIGVILYIFYSLCRARLSTPTQMHQKSGLVKEIRLMRHYKDLYYFYIL